VAGHRGHARRLETAWNRRGASQLKAFAGSAPRPAKLIAQRAAGGVVTGTVSSGAAGSAPALALGAPACILTVATTARRVTRVSGRWYFGHVEEWRMLAKAPAGALAANARLLPDGSLALS
jgi:hypothetical protein